MMDAFPNIISALLAGALTAAQVALGAGLIAFILGLLLALVNVFTQVRVVRLAIAAYIEWMRNVPALAHLFLLYFGL
ncbi:MAG: ABC transporter permease subunit, partial [Rhizobacter sp.]